MKPQLPVSTVATVAAFVLVCGLAVPPPAQSQSSGAAQTRRGPQTSQSSPTGGGDPDRPVITGRLPNPVTPGPVGVLRQATERGRLTLIDPQGGRHPIPDGTYGGLRTDGTIVVQGKKVTVKGSKDVVLKGSKIPENDQPAPGGGSNRLALDDTAGHELLRQLPDDTYRNPAGQSLTIRAGRIVRLQGF